MHPHVELPSPLRRLALIGVGAILALLGLEATAVAQIRSAVAATKVIQSPADVTFDLLARAEWQTSQQSERVRRFRDQGGSLFQVRERLTLQATGTPDSPFRLEFVDAVGVASDASVVTKWQDLYRKNEGLLHGHGSFRVRDAQVARNNYRIYDFGVTTRIGREVRRVVVFPLSLDKGIWLIDVDTTTGVQLYSAEFDRNLQLLSELETTAFSTTVGSRVPSGSAGAAAGLGPATPFWQPRMLVNRFTTFDTAAAALPGARVLQPAIAPIVSDYQQHFVQVTEDPVNGDRTLVLGYTDGVDEFFVLQSSGCADPFKVGGLQTPNTKAAGKARAVSAAGKTHSIGCYDDPAMRFYVFFERDLLFQIVGRGSLSRLKDVSMRICQQAVTGS